MNRRIIDINEELKAYSIYVFVVLIILYSFDIKF